MRPEELTTWRQSPRRGTQELVMASVPPPRSDENHKPMCPEVSINPRQRQRRGESGAGAQRDESSAAATGHAEARAGETPTSDGDSPAASDSLLPHTVKARGAQSSGECGNGRKRERGSKSGGAGGTDGGARALLGRGRPRPAGRALRGAARGVRDPLKQQDGNTPPHVPGYVVDLLVSASRATFCQLSGFCCFRFVGFRGFPMELLLI